MLCVISAEPALVPIIKALFSPGHSKLIYSRDFHLRPRDVMFDWSSWNKRQVIYFNGVCINQAIEQESGPIYATIFLQPIYLIALILLN